MHLIIFKLIVAIGIALSSIQAQATANSLDVNDVSFLFPLKDGRPYPNWNVVEKNIVSQDVFADVLLFDSQLKNINELPYLNATIISNRSVWHVTSMRFDLCADVFQLEATVDPVNNEAISLARKGSGCQPRLRFVIQPFNDFGNPLPTAMHVLFDLNSAQSLQVMNTLVKVKQIGQQTLNQKTTGLPLVVHPSLQREIELGKSEVGAAMNDIISPVLTTSGASPFLITLIVRDSINHWKFVGGRVVNGRWQRFVTRFSQRLNDGKMLLGIEDFACTLFSVCTLTPMVLPKDGIHEKTIVSEIFQNDPELSKIQTPGHRTSEIFQKAELIDDVSQVHFF